ncbi:Protein indeterminate-domain like [Melia azedarach]|uniref:Protein indeterminate-domain like n=1 Tax=Melia azedarach TaxID=155640 RepID=A0ACC1XAT7_MELAZ|nr:Protein indeterminate-domain like [Melia azedarach]
MEGTMSSRFVSASSGSRVETGPMYTQQSFSSSTNEAPPPKRKRSLPGNPDPDADVIALSPKSLLATNRFICEICNKGFQRDQNLQLHRRGHNLPWKLKQRTNKVERKKVYVCPEPTCVHHDPSRALGDLTGIKKHFSRKHGEKKWKCEKCSKRYAVQSDWKAHSKICGTREYKCDCGKLFSRRDSFITHRAFCDILAEESAKAITANPLFPSQQPGSSASHMLNLPPQFQSHGVQLQSLSVKREEDQLHIFNQRPDTNSIPPWLACRSGIAAGPGPPPLDLSSQLFSGSSFSQYNENPSPNPNSTPLSPFQPPTNSPHTSATALLQKAAQMGVTMSKPSPLPAAMLRPHQTHMTENTGSTSVAISTAGSGLGLSSREDLAGAGAADAAPSLFHDMMSSLSSASGFDGSSSSFDEALNGMLNPKAYSNFQETQLSKKSESQLSRNDHENGAGSRGGGNVGGSDGLTRDFLGLKTFPHRDFVNLAGLDHMNRSPSTYGHQLSQNPKPWQG